MGCSQGVSYKRTVSLLNAVQAACVVPPDHFMAGAPAASARLFKIICLLYLRIGVMRLSGGLVQNESPQFTNTQ